MTIFGRMAKMIESVIDTVGDVLEKPFFSLSLIMYQAYVFSEEGWNVNLLVLFG